MKELVRELLREPIHEIVIDDNVSFSASMTTDYNHTFESFVGWMDKLRLVASHSASEFSSGNREASGIHCKVEFAPFLPNNSNADCKVRHSSLVAVDAGAVSLGESATHLFIALRAAIVVLPAASETASATMLRTGVLPLPLDLKGRMDVLHSVGEAMGAPSFFVTLEDMTGNEKSATRQSRPRALKGGSASSASHYSDRLRALLERLAQRVAVSAIENGTILFDGALTLRSRDTPDAFLRDLARQAGKLGNSIVAVSKVSELLVRGRPVQFWLDDAPDLACYRNLTAELRRDGLEDQRAERVLGNVYAARLSPRGPTFRVDVKAAPGLSDAEALDQFYQSAQMRLGYPELLVRAHALCSFSSADIAAFKADACTQFGLQHADHDHSRPKLTAVFAPFSGRYK